MWYWYQFHFDSVSILHSVVDAHFNCGEHKRALPPDMEPVGSFHFGMLSLLGMLSKRPNRGSQIFEKLGNDWN